MSMRSCLPLTSLRFLGPAFSSLCSENLVRASYSTTGSSKRLLQTATQSSSTIGIEPPPPRASGVKSSITNVGNETLSRHPLPTRPPAPPRQSTISFEPPSNTVNAAAATTSLAPTAAKSPLTRTKFKPRKAAMTLTQPAIEQLNGLLAQPDPKLIRVGVKNRGCSGLAYHLEYVDKPGKFDEEVVQDGVRVLIDSKALFSIIGSEMDWVEDKLSARFVFRNPNISELPFAPALSSIFLKACTDWSFFLQRNSVVAERVSPLAKPVRVRSVTVCIIDTPVMPVRE
ncbi:Iron-sulfur assembly protein 1 [Rhizina undulata]